MYLIVCCCYVAIPPKPKPPTISANGTTSVIVQIDVPPTNITVTIICSVKYQKKGEATWQEVHVPNCQSVIITHLKPGHTYIFVVVLIYQGETSGSTSDPVGIDIKPGKCLSKLLNAL